jgi:hypothetical protein
MSIGGSREQFRDVFHLLVDLREQLEWIAGAGTDQSQLVRQVAAAHRLLDQLTERLQDLAEAGPQLVGPAGGVLRMRARQVQPRDRLIADLRLGLDWPDRPEIVGAESAGPLGLLRLLFAGETNDGHAIPADDLVLVDRPAPPPPVDEEVMAAALAGEEEPSPAAATVDEGLARIAELLAPPLREPVQDPERGALWLPSLPRPWAGRFARAERAR